VWEKSKAEVTFAIGCIRKRHIQSFKAIETNRKKTISLSFIAKDYAKGTWKRPSKQKKLIEQRLPKASKLRGTSRALGKATTNKKQIE